VSVRRRARSPAEQDLAHVADVFNALAHASRRQILLVLRFRGGAMTRARSQRASRAAGRRRAGIYVSSKAAGLVLVEKRGRERVYRLEAKRLRDVAVGWLRSF